MSVSSAVTMSEYTPTTEEIREYVEVGDPKPWESPSPEVDERERRRGEAFDRWLAAHDREVAAKALRDAAERYNAETHPESDSWNPLTAGSDDFEGIMLRYAALVAEPSTPEGETT